MTFALKENVFVVTSVSVSESSQELRPRPLSKASQGVVPTPLGSRSDLFGSETFSNPLLVALCTAEGCFELTFEARDWLVGKPLCLDFFLAVED